MNIFLRELKINRKSLFSWCLGMFFMVWSGMQKYSGFQASGDAANKILDQFPEAVKKILGLNDLDFNTVLGFYGVLFLYLAVMAAIHAVLLGSSLIAKEERDKTVEFIMTKPITRNKVIFSKLAAGFINILLLNVFTFLVSVSTVANYNSGDPELEKASLLMLGMFMIQLIFFSVGLLIGAIKQKPKRAGSVSSAAMMFTFFIYIILGLNESLDFLKYFSPFKYFEAAEIINNGGFEPVYFVLSVLIIFLSTSAAFYFFNKRDLNV